jgi:hypothetical protein
VDASTGQRQAAFTISTGSIQTPGVIHSRAWTVPADDEALEALAATLTEEYGVPLEWVSDDSESPGRPQVVFYGSEPGS